MSPNQLGRLTFIALPIDSQFANSACSPRLVPALNVIAEHFEISDDVAGATLMAAGASSPELFSSFLALFVTHSALGLGTVSYHAKKRVCALSLHLKRNFIIHVILVFNDAHRLSVRRFSISW